MLGSDTTLFQLLTAFVGSEVVPADCLKLLAVVIKHDRKSLFDSSTPVNIINNNSMGGAPSFRVFACKLAQEPPQRCSLKLTAAVVKEFLQGGKKTTEGLYTAMRKALVGDNVRAEVEKVSMSTDSGKHTEA
jgi:hypothetical protein